MIAAIIHVGLVESSRLVGANHEIRSHTHDVEHSSGLNGEVARESTYRDFPVDDPSPSIVGAKLKI